MSQKTKSPLGSLHYNRVHNKEEHKSMIDYRITNEQDIDPVMEIRLEMLREVNDLSEQYKYPDSFVSVSREYFLHGDQTTILALSKGKPIGCASICYIKIMPTFSHPAGRRAHLMNVYTSKDYRRQGIAEKMVQILINDARQRGATEISLDTTQAGRLFYRSLGFADSEECMVMTLDPLNTGG